MLHIGDVLDNKYKILGEIGRGGMSVVYLAINERANKTWAVKEVRKDGRMDPAQVSRGLMAEIGLLKKLSHPNLPAIIDVIDSDDSFIIVMDYIEGQSLAELIAAEGPQSEEKVIFWAKQLADVLHYLHSQDPPVIYRDMKPGNIMLKPDGTVCLIDFGTAREYKFSSPDTDTTCLGTRGYAAPEQFGGMGQTDARTDIYCLGTTLYHLLTGQDPAKPPYEIKPIGCFNPVYAGSGLEKLILKCTRQDPELRFRDAGELREALRHYKEEDDEKIRLRRRAGRLFTVCITIGCAALAGMIWLRFSYEEAKQSSYEARIDQAMSAESLEEAVPYFKQAMETEAGDALVYEKLLQKAGTEIAGNGSFTSEDAALVNSCIFADADRSGTNCDILAKEDPEQYAVLMYELGLWYFFLKDNTPADRRNASNYFSRIENEEYLAFLTEGQREMLKVLNGIGKYSGALGSDMARIGSDVEKSYSDLFSDLREMVSGDLKSRVEKDYYCLAVYRQAACWLDQNYADFMGDGVSPEELREMLGMIEHGVKALGIEKENVNYRDYLNTVDTVLAAKSTIERIREAEERKE